MLFVWGYANADETPTSVPGVTTVDADWVKANMGKVKVYDARKKGEYAEGHIPGAVLATYDEQSKKAPDFDPSQDKWDMSVYPTDKNTPIVVYCNGVKCWKSYKSVVRLHKAGYKKIYWLRTGFPEWQSKGYPVE